MERKVSEPSHVSEKHFVCDNVFAGKDKIKIDTLNILTFLQVSSLKMGSENVTKTFNVKLISSWPSSDARYLPLFWYSMNLILFFVHKP
jgi:hypothetical protein